MKIVRAGGLIVGSLILASCTPDWAKQNSAPFILEISGINGGAAVLSDVGFPVVNDDVSVSINALRKNNNPDLGVSPAEHIYLERYEVRYFRTDGRNQEGVDVPYRISGPLGNLRFHTPGPGGEGEVEITIGITLVRHQAKLEPPLRNLQQGLSIPPGFPAGAPLPGAGVITTIAEVTIHGRTLQGEAMVAVGSVQVTFADFPSSN